MNRDMVLEAIEHSRRESILLRFIDSPLRTIRERRYLLYLISGGMAMACAAVAFCVGVDPANQGPLLSSAGLSAQGNRADCYSPASDDDLQTIGPLYPSQH